MFALARARNLFCMEAMRTRFQLAHVRMRELLAEGVIGEPRMLRACLGLAMPLDVLALWMNVHAGGCALALGVHPTALGVNVFSKGGVEQPSLVVAVGDLSIAEKVDVQLQCMLQYGPGRMAVLSNSMQANLDCEAHISGTKGWMKIFRPEFHCAHKIIFKRDTDPPCSPSPSQRLPISRSMTLSSWCTSALK